MPRPAHNRQAQKPLRSITPAVRLGAALVLVGAAALMAGALVGGLERMGVAVGGAPSVLVYHHGPLMVGAFFGAVISMERAVALRAAWSFLAPVTAVAGGIAIVAFEAPFAASLLFLASGLCLIAVFIHLLRRRFEPFTLAMGVGALCFAAGSGLWVLEAPLSEVVPWWASFLVLTIAGERLELSRFRAQTQSRRGFWAGFVLSGAGLTATLLAFDVGVRLLGAGFVFLAVWLAFNDIARATIHRRGAPRFMAAALFAGYFWLAVAGALALVVGGTHAGLMYDATWHAVFVGFVFSMIFAHAQVILPALTGLRVRHGAWFYAPLVLLHLATALRVAGDLSTHNLLRRAGGVGNVAAIALFAVVLATSVWRARRPAKRSSSTV